MQAPTLRCTPCGGWSGRRTRRSGGVVWSARLRRHSRLEVLGLLSPSEERGMGE